MTRALSDLGGEREAQRRCDAEQRFRATFEYSPLGMALVAPDGRWIDVNHALCEMTGCPKETLVNASAQQFTHPEDVEAERRLLRQMVEGGMESSRADRRYIDARGETLHVRVSLALVRQSDGRSPHLVAQIENVTERGRTERALRDSRQRLQALIDNIVAAVYLKDLDGRYVLANSEVASFAGRTPQQLVGRTDEDVFPSPLARELRLHDQRALEAGGPIEYEEEIERDGGVRTYLSQRFVLRDEHDVPYAIGGIATDISERVRVEDENRRLENQIHRFERLETVGRLAGGIAHDFNNLLAVIINYAALAADELSAQSAVQGDINEIQKAAERAASLTQQLLAFSRQEYIEPEVLNLDALVNGTEALLRSTLGENVELILAGSPSLWSAEAGSDQLQRILLNLALNARDAMPGGGTLRVATENVTLTREQLASLVEPIPPGDYVCLSVADTGKGMSEAVATRAFEPFFSTKPPAEGTGLGLATVYGLVRQMNGGLRLETAPGGTTVRVYLPATERSLTAVAAEVREGARYGAGETILVVEDEEAVLAAVARILRRSGYEVLPAPPERAIGEVEARRQPIDLLLTDLVMPRMSGAELAEKLASRQPGLRVLFMSGYSDDGVVGRDLASGEHPLLTKPFTPAQLLDAVGRVLAPRSDGPLARASAGARP
ncbi:MAG: PAS domain S-box protein [Chloroflexota bacterium]|nr:PAS domain S-box protein [Chloroflexota bacterium]